MSLCTCVDTSYMLMYSVFSVLQLISPYSVAVYSGLCALACFDRQELYTRVISSRLVCGYTIAQARHALCLV